ALKEDMVVVKGDITALKGNIAQLEKEVLNFEWQMRLYLVAIGALILITNPRVLDLLAKLVGIAP
ncbi:MAG: hypothetical protein ACE5NP_01390, partial [Anaerolineae bacterium]